MNTVLMGGSEETRSWTSEDEGTRWVRTVSWGGNGEETLNMQGAEPVEGWGLQKYKDFQILVQLTPRYFTYKYSADLFQVQTR